MKAILVYPGHELWPVWCNLVYEEYNYTVVIFSEHDPEQYSPLEFVDTYTEMAARTVLDAVNLGIISDWRKLYG
ncbi:hypothetical protein SU503_05 [Klebsiella phage vB_KpnP_SU503]|uniref:DNA topoisomerase II large subunit n=1 Tax=Klebsiella phage vB_KpnP_SU503 TaxID=1610834 RepID=A0A0C5Q3V8_9CAUD|nr:hypothetical protein AVT68_gp06 [Klebsiella phage vB_KpnP_SU503]AJQ21073.1 hypothetical protein SU503_05 [Klebsiella phage vB_KpnP_SU503]